MDKNLLLQEGSFVPAAPIATDIKAVLRSPFGITQAEQVEAADRIEDLERQLAEASKDMELIEIVRTLVCEAARKALPNSENYPSPLSHFSPLMIAARQACLDRGFTAGGLSIDTDMKEQA